MSTVFKPYIVIIIVWSVVDSVTTMRSGRDLQLTVSSPSASKNMICVEVSVRDDTLYSFNDYWREGAARGAEEP